MLVFNSVYFSGNLKTWGLFLPPDRPFIHSSFLISRYPRFMGVSRKN